MSPSHSIDSAYRRFILIHHEPFDWPTRRRRKPRRMTLARAVKAVRKAGVSITLPDGTVVTSTDTPVSVEINEWDSVQ